MKILCINEVHEPNLSNAPSSDTRKNYEDQCTVCGEVPTVGDSGLCGPCFFGEADTVDGNW